MNSRDLLRAIAQTDEKELDATGRFSEIGEEIRSERKKKRRTLATLGAAAALGLTALAIAKAAPRMFTTVPPDGETAAPSFTEETDPGVTENLILRETGATVPGTEDPSPAAPTVGPILVSPTQGPETNATGEFTGETPDGGEMVSAPVQPGGPETANAVLTSVPVGYEEAKEAFGHPIKACADGDFTGYTVGVVSKNGDIGAPEARCLQAVYHFTDGILCLTDQDRMPGTHSPEGEAFHYAGRVFYIDPPNDADPNDNDLRVEYFPTGERGLCYQAVFSPDADPYRLMGLIISLEV